MQVNNEKEVIEPNSQLIQVPKQHPYPKFQCVTVHQLDCIYHGEINKSYQRQGFGILQTIDFDTYFGFWKNGKAEGVGLIIYSEGSILYGNFYRNQFFGPVIVDDKQTLKIAFCEGNSKIGLVYQYSYPTSMWKILDYSKKESAMVVHEEYLPISQKLPDMVMAQHSISYFLINYLSKQYFQGLDVSYSRGKEQKAISKQKFDQRREDNYIEKYSNLTECLVSSEGDLLIFGFRKDNELEGLACIYEQSTKQLFQAGFYHSGYLEGFAFQKKNTNSYTIGCYQQGLKHGYFFEPNFEDQDPIISEYQNDQFVRHHKIGEELFRKRQKSYNYQQKDFLSAPNLFMVRTLRKIANDSRQTYPRYSQERQYVKTTKKPVSFGKTLTNKAQLAEAMKKSNTIVSNMQEMEKTSLQMMRAKMIDYELVSTERQARELSFQKRKGLLNSKARISDAQQQQIAEEQNPFDSALLGINLINQSPSRRPN